MPDTPARWPAELLSPKRLTEIERRHPVRAGGRPSADYGEVEELLAHIDALTAAVEGLPRVHMAPNGWAGKPEDFVQFAAVLAILRGEQ